MRYFGPLGQVGVYAKSGFNSQKCENKFKFYRRNIASIIIFSASCNSPVLNFHGHVQIWSQSLISYSPQKNKLTYTCFLKLNLCNNYIQMKQKRVNGRFANAKGKNKRNKCLTRQQKGKYIAQRPKICWKKDQADDDKKIFVEKKTKLIVVTPQGNPNDLNNAQH